MGNPKTAKNDYLVRLDRFERFTKKLKQLDVHNLFEIEELTDKPTKTF